MENLETVNLSVNLTDLAQQVQRVTNYADASSANPTAANVLNATADAQIYADLLNAAKLRVKTLLGRHCRRLEQTEGADGCWQLTLQLPPNNSYALLKEQLEVAVRQCLATYVAAHWLMLVKSEHAGNASVASQDAQTELHNLSLWQRIPIVRPVNPIL